MDPTGFQCSINDPFNDKAGGWRRPPLPRSFKPSGHGIRACGAFPGLLIAHRGPNPSHYGKRRSGAFEGLSWDSLRLSKDPLLGLSSVSGNSRARVLARVQGKQTRTVGYGRMGYGVLSNLSIDHSRDPVLDHFSLVLVEGNSRAFSLSVIQRNQTRILFFFFTSTALRKSISWGKGNYVGNWLSCIPVISNTGMKSPGRDFSTDSCLYARIRIPVCWAYQVVFAVRIKIRG